MVDFTDYGLGGVENYIVPTDAVVAANVRDIGDIKLKFGECFRLIRKTLKRLQVTLFLIFIAMFIRTLFEVGVEWYIGFSDGMITSAVFMSFIYVYDLGRRL